MVTVTNKTAVKTSSKTKTLGRKIASVDEAQALHENKKNNFKFNF